MRFALATRLRHPVRSLVLGLAHCSEKAATALKLLRAIWRVSTPSASTINGGSCSDGPMRVPRTWR